RGTGISPREALAHDLVDDEVLLRRVDDLPVSEADRRRIREMLEGIRRRLVTRDGGVAFPRCARFSPSPPSSPWPPAAAAGSGSRGPSSPSKPTRSAPSTTRRSGRSAS